MSHVAPSKAHATRSTLTSFQRSLFGIRLRSRLLRCVLLAETSNVSAQRSQCKCTQNVVSERPDCGRDQPASTAARCNTTQARITRRRKAALVSL
eukprot:365747-Chlamydomonas_euryale.AAC.39